MGGESGGRQRAVYTASYLIGSGTGGTFRTTQSTGKVCQDMATQPAKLAKRPASETAPVSIAKATPWVRQLPPAIH